MASTASVLLPGEMSVPPVHPETAAGSFLSTIYGFRTASQL